MSTKRELLLLTVKGDRSDQYRADVDIFGNISMTITGACVLLRLALQNNNDKKERAVIEAVLQELCEQFEAEQLMAD